MKSRQFVVSALLAIALGLIVGNASAAAGAGTPPGAAGAGTGSANGLYRVELIIFRHVAAPGGSEDFGAPAEGRGFSGRQEGSNAPPRVARLLEESELQMGATAAALRANAGFQVLAHTGWLQTATLWPRHIGLPLDQLGINVDGLSGNLFLERGELLHFGANLHLGSNPGYALSELRKLRFNERHYIDNPAFGIIVQVSPTRSSLP